MRQMLSAVRHRLFRPSETIEGYEQPELVDVIFRKTLAYRPVVPWDESSKSVLDFGGACGLHYKGAADDVRWAVVETPAMVKRASELATDHLRFFTSIRGAADWLGSIDLMHSNGALQYTPDPEAALLELCALGANAMLWSRTLLSQGTTETEIQTSHLVDSGPGKIGGIKNKAVRHHVTRIPETTFLFHHGESGYRLMERTADSFRFARA